MGKAADQVKTCAGVVPRTGDRCTNKLRVPSDHTGLVYCKWHLRQAARAAVGAPKGNSPLGVDAAQVVTALKTMSQPPPLPPAFREDRLEHPAEYPSDYTLSDALQLGTDQADDYLSSLDVGKRWHLIARLPYDRGTQRRDGDFAWPTTPHEAWDHAGQVVLEHGLSKRAGMDYLNESLRIRNPTPAEALHLQRSFVGMFMNTDTAGVDRDDDDLTTFTVTGKCSGSKADQWYKGLFDDQKFAVTNEVEALAFSVGCLPEYIELSVRTGEDVVYNHSTGATVRALPGGPPLTVENRHHFHLAGFKRRNLHPLTAHRSPLTEIEKTESSYDHVLLQAHATS